MTAEDQNASEAPSPFTRPGFITAAVVVAALVVLGVVVAVNSANNTQGGTALPTSSTTASAVPTVVPTAATTSGKSVCGLKGVERSGRLTAAPAVDSWEYQGATSYPSSKTYGPGKSDSGFMYCFQQSPSGALFAASYALAAAADPDVSSTWVNYFAAPGPNRDQLLQAASSSSTDGVRFRIAGFRLLAYTGTTARVDLAAVASTKGQTIKASFIYDLVWVDGDWKLSTETDSAGAFSTLPDLVGYITWGS